MEPEVNKDVEACETQFHCLEIGFQAPITVKKYHWSPNWSGNVKRHSPSLIWTNRFRGLVIFGVESIQLLIRQFGVPDQSFLRVLLASIH
jgi:hypothetical protein